MTVIPNEFNSFISRWDGVYHYFNVMFKFAAFFINFFRISGYINFSSLKLKFHGMRIFRIGIGYNNNQKVSGRYINIYAFKESVYLPNFQVIIFITLLPVFEKKNVCTDHF